MAVAFSEFDSTPDTLVDDIKAAILLSADWTNLATQTIVRSTFSALEAVGQTVLSVLTPNPAFLVGQVVVLSPGTANEETRTISAVGAGTITVSVATGFSHAANDEVAMVHESVLKSTADSGAELVVLLNRDGIDDVRGMGVSFFREHDGTTGVDESAPRYIRNRVATTTTNCTVNDPLHVVVAAGKNHLVITLEGSRTNESLGAESVNGRDIMVLSDVVLYDDLDEVPCAFAQGRSQPLASAPVADRYGMLSRDKADSTSWMPALIGTVTQPGSASTENQMIHVPQAGDLTFFPYLVFDPEEGLRGRLRHVLNAGQVVPTLTTELPQLTPGRKVTYAGATWITIAGTKCGGSATMSTPFYLYGSTLTHEGPMLLVPFSGTPTP